MKLTVNKHSQGDSIFVSSRVCFIPHSSIPFICTGIWGSLCSYHSPPRPSVWCKHFTRRVPQCHSYSSYQIIFKPWSWHPYGSPRASSRVCGQVGQKDGFWQNLSQSCEWVSRQHRTPSQFHSFNSKQAFPTLLLSSGKPPLNLSSY